MSSVYCIATMIKLKIVLNDTFMYDKKVTWSQIPVTYKKKKDFTLHLFYVSIVIQVWSNKIEHKTKPNFFLHIHEHTFSLVMDFSCVVYI